MYSLIDLDNCSCQIDTILLKNTAQYTDDDSLVVQTIDIEPNSVNYYYRIKVVAGEYTRNSFINYSSWLRFF